MFPSSTDHGDDYSRRVKISAPKMVDFSGSTSEWKKWKARTKNVLYSTGYGDIITSSDEASRREGDNKTVYTLLNTSTIDGTASHLITKHGESMDGHAAWKSLEEWYDDINRQASNAETLRDSLQETRLYSGNRCDVYINAFFKNYHELNNIEGEHMSEHQAIKLFLKNILDSDYKITVQSIESMEISDLPTVVEKIRNRANTISHQRKSQKRLRTHIRRLNRTHVNADGFSDSSDEDVEPLKKRPKRTNRPRKLTGTLETTDNGLLSLPSRDWIKLTDEEKTFIQTYNSRIKHKEATDDIPTPEGLVIKSKTRRIPSNFIESPDSTMHSTESTSNKKGKKKAKPTPAGRKKIQFRLPGPDDESSEDDVAMDQKQKQD